MVSESELLLFYFIFFPHKQRLLKALALSLGGAAKTSLIFQRLLICLSSTGREHTSALKVESAVTSWFLQPLLWNLGASLLNLLFKRAGFKLSVQVDSASVSALHMYTGVIKRLHIWQQPQILIYMTWTQLIIIGEFSCFTFKVLAAATGCCLYLFYIRMPLRLSGAWLPWQLASPILERDQETLISLPWASLAPSVSHKRRKWEWEIKPAHAEYMQTCWAHSGWYTFRQIIFLKKKRIKENRIVMKIEGCEANAVGNWWCHKKLFHHLCIFSTAVPGHSDWRTGEGNDAATGGGSAQMHGWTYD